MTHTPNHFGSPSIEVPLLESPSSVAHTGEAQTSETHLLELLSLPIEVMGQLRSCLHEMTDRALATSINPHDQETLILTSSIIEWRLFGEPGSPLPNGLVQGYKEGGSFSIVYGGRIGVGSECVKAATYKLYEVGLEEINDTVYELARKSSDQIKTVFGDIIQSSQAFRFINALASDGLPQERDELPLSPFWRGIRESGILQEVRSSYRLGPQQQIIPFTNAYRALHRKLLELDEETVRALVKPTNDPLSRLRSYLSNLVQVELAAWYPDEVFTGFTCNEDGELLICTDRSPEGFDAMGRIQAAALKLTSQISETGPHVQLLTEKWLSDLIEDILHPQGGMANFEQLSKSAVDKAWNFLKNDVLYSRTFRSDDYQDGSPAAVLHASLVNPTSEYTNLAQFGKEYSTHKHYGSPLPRAEINNTPENYIGEVLRFTPAARGQHAHRLIQSEPKQGVLPPLQGGEELILRLFGQEFRHTQPYVPGFDLVSQSDDKFGFVLGARGDPYVSADIRLAPEQRQALVTAYFDIGLQRLAHLITTKPRLTVQALALLLVAESNYILTSKAEYLNPPLKPTYLWKLAACAALVRNGTLHVQCTGASEFMRLSLEEVFGKGSAATIEGYKLARRNLSAKASHRQIIFTHQGQIYILDTTPPSGEGVQYNDYLFTTKKPGWLNFLRRPIATPMAAPAPTQTPLPSPNDAPLWSLSSAERLQAISQSLGVQLMGLYGVPSRDKLYEKLVRLPNDDPLRRTVEVARHAARGTGGRDEVERLIRYLESYQKADETLRRRVRLPSYSLQIVQLLQNTAEQLLTHY